MKVPFFSVWPCRIGNVGDRKCWFSRLLTRLGLECRQIMCGVIVCTGKCCTCEQFFFVAKRVTGVEMEFPGREEGSRVSGVRGSKVS